MEVIVTAVTCSHRLSTTLATEKESFAHFETENRLIVKGKKIQLRKSPDRYKVYLDGTVARRPTDNIVKYKSSTIRRSTDALPLHLQLSPRIGELDIRVQE